MQNFYLAVLTFRVTLTRLTFVLRDLNFLSNSQVSAAKRTCLQFTTKNQLKIAPKLV